MFNKHYITSVDDIHERSTLGFSWKNTNMRYQDYYSGKFTALFQIASHPSLDSFTTTERNNTVENGLKQLEKHGIIRMNMFKAYSDYYADATWGTPPDVVGGTNFNAWWNANKKHVLTAFRQGIGHWSVNDRCVLHLSTSNVLTAVNPIYHIPVVEPYNASIVTGHVLFYTYFENDVNDPNPEHQVITSPNRVRIVKFSARDEVNEIAIHELAGDVVGRRIRTVPGDTRAIVTFGDGNSFYEDIEDLVQTMMIRVSHNNLVLNKFSDPQFQGPGGLVDAKRTESKLVDRFNNPLIVVPDEANSNIQAITWDAHLNESNYLVNFLMNVQSIFSGVPREYFNGQPGLEAAGQSGDNLLLKTIATINEAREQLEYALRDVLYYMGAPEVESATVNFVQNPFSTFFEQRTSVIQEYQAGITQRNEAREALKHNPLPGDIGTAFSEPRPDVGTARAQDQVRDNKESER